ncbi:EamA family transporter [uncultured Senegalimassilia sp.]|uniref:EamA family transporter n=1 Tax=uncultured Senegalimassilia sp. TaxID=1714350 RepID=UPI0026732E84|nr:EamA family transporter [uncultured Senegalimassilia sp.]
MAGAFAVCAVATFALGTPLLPQSATGWGCLAVLVLVLVCSVFGFTFQPVAQKYISAVQAGMTCTTNPACASVVGVLVLGEQLTPLGWCGAALVLTALIISTLLGNKSREGNSAKAAE